MCVLAHMVLYTSTSSIRRFPGGARAIALIALFQHANAPANQSDIRRLGSFPRSDRAFFPLRLRHQAEQIAAQRLFRVELRGDAIADAAADFHHRRVRRAVVHLVAFLAPREHPAPVHQVQVARDIRLRGAEFPDDLGHGFFPFAYGMHDPQPHRLRHHGKK